MRAYSLSMKTGDLVKYTEDKLRTLERDHTNAYVAERFTQPGILVEKNEFYAGCWNVRWCGPEVNRAYSVVYEESLEVLNEVG